MNINPQQEQKFEQTPEAQEYIQKLQQGRVELPPNASVLEKSAHKNLDDLSKQVRELTTRQSDIAKQIAGLEQQNKAVAREIDLTSGQMAAYAQMLVAAEGERRDAATRAESEAKLEAAKEKVAKEKAAAKEAAKANGKGNDKVTPMKKPEPKAAEANA